MTDFDVTIQVVDDTPQNLQVLFDYLEQYNFTVVLAANGRTAIEQAIFVQPDLILLDIMMPGMDGFLTCEHLKRNPKTQDIPIIFMTAINETAHKVKAFEYGAVDYITKPFQQKEVMARINTHLRVYQQRRELVELNAMKDRFFSIIAHDTRNAFATVIGYSQLFLEESSTFQNSEQGLVELAESLYQSTHQAFNLLENLLTWAKTQSSGLEFIPHRISLNDMVAQACFLYAEQSASKQITVVQEIPPHTKVYVDEQMVRTILRNLLSNALKFTDQGGLVTVTAKPVTDEMVQLTIQDSGIGIPADKLPLLFRIDQKFTRLGTAQEQGTGLGLLLCKEFVEKHGSVLRVDSEEGRGTAFSFTLPQNSDRF